METQNNSDKPKKILFLVEDDNFLRDILGRKLIAAGYDVISFGESIKVAEEALKQQPDLILLDIIMPGKNGFDVMNELAAQPETATIPVMILSNVNQDEDREKASQKGVKEYLVKADHSPEEILQRITEVI